MLSVTLALRSSRGRRRARRRAVGRRQDAARIAGEHAGVRMNHGSAKREIVLFGPLKPLVVKGLEAACTVHKAAEAKDRDAFFAAHADVRAIACSATTEMIPASLHGALSQAADRGELRRRLRPYGRQIGGRARHHRHQHARSADRGSRRHRARAVALHRARISAGRALSCAPANGRKKGYPLSKATLRNRTVGMVGMGAIGQAIARRLDAFGVPVVYHTRASRGPNWPIGIIRSSSTWRATSTRYGHRAGRRGDGEHDQCRSARRARAERHPDQHGARLGGR